MAPLSRGPENQDPAAGGHTAAGSRYQSDGRCHPGNAPLPAWRRAQTGWSDWLGSRAREEAGTASHGPAGSVLSAAAGGSGTGASREPSWALTRSQDLAGEEWRGVDLAGVGIFLGISGPQSLEPPTHTALASLITDEEL